LTRILIINHYAGSPCYGMEYRPYYLAREWVRSGHQVQVLASSVSHVRAASPQLAGRNRLDETIDGVKYSWLRTPSYKGNGTDRVLNIASFVCRLYSAGKVLAQSFKPDAVIASSTYPMDIWPARRIAKMAKAKLVFEVHDLWPLSPMELGGMSKWHPFIVMVQMAEDYAYRHADVVVSMLPKARDYMESRGMAPHKLHIVPNGIDVTEWQADNPPLTGAAKEALSHLKAQGYFIVGYAGTHGLANALTTFLDAAKLMHSEKVAFVLVGDGPDKRDLQRWAAAKGLNNVTFIEPVKKEEIPALLQWFDIAYIGLQRQPLFRFGISPNKLMDYMMAGRPVLMAIDAGNDPVAEAGCGISIPPEEPDAIVRAVKQMMAMQPEDRAAMGQRGHTYVMAHHDYRILAKRFLDCLQ